MMEAEVAEPDDFFSKLGFWIAFGACLYLGGSMRFGDLVVFLALFTPLSLLYRSTLRIERLLSVRDSSSAKEA